MSETKTDTWKFRLENIKDSGRADEIMKLYRAATAANAEWTTWDDEYPRLEFCLSDIENGELFALCDESGSILGAVTLKDTEEELDPLPFRINGKLGNAEISRAAVSPDFACHGIAGVMLGECEKEAVARAGRSVHGMWCLCDGLPQALSDIGSAYQRIVLSIKRHQ